MTPKEIVLSGYKAFEDGDMDRLAKIFHQNAIIRVNGDHKLSGKYEGFENWRDNFLAHLPSSFPNFSLSINNVVAEGENVHVRVTLNADNLNAESIHMFVVRDGLQTEFTIFDDSQKIARALN